MRKRIRTVAAGGLAVVAAVSLAACGADNNRDVKNVQNHTGYLRNYENADGQPNIIFACIHGVPVLTTTRSGAGALHIVTQASAVKFCEHELTVTGK